MAPKWFDHWTTWAGRITASVKDVASFHSAASWQIKKE